MVDPTKPFTPAPPPLEERPAADVQAVPTDAGAALAQNSAIRWPEEDLTDFPVRVRSSVLGRCRERLERLEKSRFAPGELLLGVACTALGGVLSALTSGIGLDSLRGGIFFIGLPVIAVGAGVAYAIYRQNDLLNVQHTAKETLRDLPDPQKAVPEKANK